MPGGSGLWGGSGVGHVRGWLAVSLNVASGLGAAAMLLGMVVWEYLWRETYWATTGESDGYVSWVSYEHVWKPDLETAELFPNDNGLDALGRQGWELVAMVPVPVSLVTRRSKQSGDSYSQFFTFTLMFKRPRAAADSH